MTTSAARRGLAVTAVCLVIASLPLLCAGDTASAIRFDDIVPNLAISYTSNNHYTGRKYFPQPMCGGVAILDYDLDGNQDIYFTNGSILPELKKDGEAFSHLLLRNLGEGKFADVTVAAGVTGEHLDFTFGVAAGDFDNDGYPDLFLANAGPNALYHNNGDGTFTDVAAESGIGTKPPDTLSVQGAWLDYNNDGRLDLVLSNYTYWTPEKDIVCKDSSGEVYCSPTVYPAVPHRLYKNLGAGKFADVTAEAGFAKALGKGMGIGIADFNRDGFIDIFIANDTERNFLYLNREGERFQESGILLGVAYNDSGATVSAMGCDVKDFDNDGWPDVFYNNLMQQIHGLFRNENGTGFVYSSPRLGVEHLSRSYSGWSNGFIDFDNDGWKDIYSANGHVDDVGHNTRQADTMLRNVDGRSFTDVSGSLGPDFVVRGYKRGSAFGDLNNDGFLDLVVTALNDPPRILMNSASNGNHWLLVSLEGATANRDAVGAELKLTTASGRTLHNHVTTSVGFMSSSDKRVHFGLGQETGIKSLEIRWPGGETQTLTEIVPDTIIHVRQPPD